MDITFIGCYYFSSDFLLLVLLLLAFSFKVIDELLKVLVFLSVKP